MHAWATRESSRSSPLFGHRPPVVTNPAGHLTRSALSLSTPPPSLHIPTLPPVHNPVFYGVFFLLFSRTRDRLMPLALSPWTLLTPTGTPLAMVRALGV